MEPEKVKERVDRWLWSKGRYDEDLASEMILYCIDKLNADPDMQLSMKIVEMRARDKITPRTIDSDGKRVYRDAMDHQTSNVIAILGEEKQERTSMCQFTAEALYAPRRGRMTARRKNAIAMRAAQYLSRLPFGHLPFVL